MVIQTWWCTRCTTHGSVTCAENADVTAVVQKILEAHQQARSLQANGVRCPGGVRTIRVLHHSLSPPLKEAV